MREVGVKVEDRVKVEVTERKASVQIYENGLKVSLTVRIRVKIEDRGDIIYLNKDAFVKNVEDVDSVVSEIMKEVAERTTALKSIALDALNMIDRLRAHGFNVHTLINYVGMRYSEEK